MLNDTRCPPLTLYERLIEDIEGTYAYAERLRSRHVQKAAVWHESALIRHMISDLGIGARLLASIDVRTDLHRDSMGRVASICVAAAKSSENHCREWALTESLRDRLQRHLDAFCPRSAAGASSLLFPNGVENVIGLRRNRQSTETPPSASSAARPEEKAG